MRSQNELKDQLLNKIDVLKEMNIPVFFKKVNNDCSKCELRNDKKQIDLKPVNSNIDIMFIGGLPETSEDGRIKAFANENEIMLIKIIEAMKLKENQVYFYSIIKCLVGKKNINIKNTANLCEIFLKEQIEIVNPKIICTMGDLASQVILKTQKTALELRGQSFLYNNIEVIPTLHTSDCLRDANNKKLVWEDMKKIINILELATSK